MNFIGSRYPCQQPCPKSSHESVESTSITESDFGECYVQPLDSQFFPCIIPVYNGTTLKIKPDVVHAALSGISIKHYYGKCFQELEDKDKEKEKVPEAKVEEQLFYGPEDFCDYDIFDFEERTKIFSPKNSSFYRKPLSQSYGLGSRQFDSYKNSKDSGKFGHERPICMREKINFRNSFWNLHKPELCKLTWPQKYVSSATVIQHLHGHLTSHGSLCVDFHEEELWSEMLDKELFEYGRLKTIVPPRNLPPDEKLFNFKIDDFARLICKGLPSKKPTIIKEDRFLHLSDDDMLQSEKNSIHRSKEEFCLTIGRPIKKFLLKKSLSDIERHASAERETAFNPEEEVKESTSSYGMNWLDYNPEEYYDDEITDDTSIDFDSITEPLIDACPPLMIDDFCRAVAKADFSDLRCNPDDF